MPPQRALVTITCVTQGKDKDGKWQDIKVADSIRALIIINLQVH